MPDLYPELKRATFAVRQPHIDRLKARGADMLAIAEMGRHFHPFGVERVIDAGGGCYIPSDEGEPWVILPVYDDWELVDLVAFPTSAPDNWLLRLGVGWLLGLNDGRPSLENQETVRLHRSPLDWLRAGGDGISILDWSAPELFTLNDLAGIVVDDPGVKRQLVAALTRPVRLPNITISQEVKLAA